MRPKNIFIISNRLPITVVRLEKGFGITSSSGGLATALQSVFEQKDSYWIGWPGVITNTKEEEEQIVDLLKPFRCIPVFLTELQFEGYYNGFSNAILWPLFHYHPGHCVFDQHYWEIYKEVNNKFANIINRYTQKDDFIWIHDYQLMLIPNYIDHQYMSYFHHIHFPAVEMFGIIPWRADLLKAIYKCNHLVFQTERDCNNFKQAYSCFVDGESDRDLLKSEGVDKRISFHPISIDAQEFSLTASSSEVNDIVEKIKMAFDSCKIILSVDRIDYSKGVLERLSAFKQLLKEYPEYHSKIVLIMIVVPSRTNVLSYKKHKKKVDELVGNINAIFATPEWRPVHYYYKHFDRETLCAYYATADICLITSLRDGLNLVSKEYVACRNNSNGILILSEMAGAAQELKYALKVHPYDTGQIKSAIHYALSMDEREEHERMQYLRVQIFNNTIFDWVSKIFQEVFSLYKNISYAPDQDLSAELMIKIKFHFKRAHKRYILLDYDGCLRELEPHPEMATPTSEIHNLLEKLIMIENTKVFLVSGRSRADMEKWFGHTKVNIIAEHGAWYKEYLGEWRDLRPDSIKNKECFLEFLNPYLINIPDSFIEEKSSGYCLHFGTCKPKNVTLYLNQLVNDFFEYIELNNLLYRCTISPTQFEILPIGCNKGKAIQKVISFADHSFVLAAGDDDTDEDMFKVLPETSFTFKIGRKDTCAKIRIPEVNRFINFLSNVANFPLV